MGTKTEVDLEALEGGEGLSEIKLKPCPFCGSDSIKVTSREDRFLGENEFGVKKIKIHSCVLCNKCYARGSCATGIIHKNTSGERDERMEIDDDAIKKWNKRTNEGGDS